MAAFIADGVEVEKVMLICLKCGGTVSKSKNGRPPVYCGPSCRRSAEFEIRRLDRRIARLEDQLCEERGLRGPFKDVCDLYGRGREARIAYLEGEITTAEIRFKLLLSSTESE